MMKIYEIKQASQDFFLLTSNNTFPDFKNFYCKSSVVTITAQQIYEIIIWG